MRDRRDEVTNQESQSGTVSTELKKNKRWETVALHEAEKIDRWVRIKGSRKVHHIDEREMPFESHADPSKIVCVRACVRQGTPAYCRAARPFVQSLVNRSHFSKNIRKQC